MPGTKLTITEGSCAPAYNIWTMANVTGPERLRVRSSNNSIPVDERTFQSAAAHWHASLGWVALKIAHVLGNYFYLRDGLQSYVFTQFPMPRRSDDEESRLPSDLDYATQPTDRRKRGAERVPFSC